MPKEPFKTFVKYYTEKFSSDLWVIKVTYHTLEEYCRDEAKERAVLAKNLMTDLNHLDVRNGDAGNGLSTEDVITEANVLLEMNSDIPVQQMREVFCNEYLKLHPIDLMLVDMNVMWCYESSSACEKACNLPLYFNFTEASYYSYDREDF